MKWYYRKYTGEKVRDPNHGEFFATEAIRNPAEAIVREAVQNSLDARIKVGEPRPVHVRFFLATGADSLPFDEAKVWFEGAWDHLHASGNGLSKPPQVGDDCPFLVYEDFGTTGLQGNVEATWPPDDEPNPFFYFFRAEGRSGKSKEDRGRWGVGKHVFPGSSKAKSFFGLTVRADDKKCFLMGESILKSHMLGNDAYTPDGYFGISGDTQLTVPVDDYRMLERFANDFKLVRRAEPGLSIVVPWVVEEITIADIEEAVVRDYFLPILQGSLTVDICTLQTNERIDCTTLLDAALRLNSDESQDLLNLIDLGEWASTVTSDKIISLDPCDPQRPKWENSLIPSEQFEALQNKLERGEKIAVKSTLTVREVDKAPQEADFCFYLRKDDYDSGRPAFLRDGITISDVKAPRSRGVRSLVIVNGGALGTLLGDAENPAHTEWQAKSEKFKDKYVYAKSYLTFVIDIVYNFVHALRAQEEHEDTTLLLDVFSIPDNQEEESVPRSAQKSSQERGPDPAPEPKDVEPRRKRFKLSSYPGGFTIVKGDKGTSPPARLIVKVGYDVRRGNPLGKYDPADFRLDKAPIRFHPAPQGIVLAEVAENKIVAEICDPEFQLTVVGFDEKRDLFVNVRIEEDDNDS